MSLGGFLKGAKKVLGVITDLLLIGRAKGWWDEKHGNPVRRKK